MELDVRYVARLARLRLNTEEIKLLGKQLEDILNYIDKLKEVDIKGVQPTTHVVGLKNVFREDKIVPSSDSAEVLKGAPSQKDRFVKVPPVLK